VTSAEGVAAVAPQARYQAMLTLQRTAGNAAVTTLVQRSGGAELCGQAQPCTTGDACAVPDPGTSGMCLEEPTLEVLIDTEEGDWETALRKQHFGHAFVRLTDTEGHSYTYGFYPAGQLPNETRRQVPGCVRHPDTSHAACVDATVRYTLTQEQLNAALAAAQAMCRSPHEYGERYTCTSFVGEVARAAGQSLPSSASAPTTIYYQHVPSIDNPNTLQENVEAEHHIGSDSDVRQWVSSKGASDIAAAPIDDLIKRSQRLLEGWISDDDVAALETICRAVSPSQRTQLASALSSHVQGMFSSAQQTRVNRALSP
jgi:hypothetical protein